MAVLMTAEVPGATEEQYRQINDALGITPDAPPDGLIVHNLPDEGTVWVTTGTQPRSVSLTVENTGEQLSPQSVATLVEPFLRGTERTRADHSGVGLGLAIVKSITRAHDGTLTLTPRPAGGLRVSVQLPAAPARPG
jgi:two-component system sensor histidine kinase VanS